MSLRTYWGLAVLLVAAYLGFWSAIFPWIYGWQTDDWVYYAKGCDTAASWKAPMTVHLRAHHLYFYGYALPAIASGLSIPSRELPIYGEQTGNYRFFLLATILYHGAVALVWAWFAQRVCRPRIAALVSLGLLLASPQFLLWTPQPETRFVSLPFALLAVGLLLRREDGTRRATAARMFAAGTAVGLTLETGYTGLYLLLPVAFVFCLADLRRGWSTRAVWEAWALFAVGCLWLHVLFEIVSRWAVHGSWSMGPTMALIRQFETHATALGWSERLALWWEFARRLLGLPMLAAAAAGGWWFARGAANDVLTRRQRRCLAAGVAAAVLFVLLVGSQPFMRQTAAIQPLLFLFAALAVVRATAWIARRPAARAMLGGLALAAIAYVPSTESLAVLRGHLGLGRLWAWADAHRGQRQLRWFITRRPFLYTRDDIERDDPNHWVLTYHPIEPLANEPSLAAALETVAPIRREPTLWSTYTVHAEHVAYANYDVRQSGLLSEARLYRVGDLQAALRADRTLRVERLAVDTSCGGPFEEANLFDHDAAPDGQSAWMSWDTNQPHVVEIAFREPGELSGVDVVQRAFGTPKITAMEVRGACGGDSEDVLWRRDALPQATVVSARWAPRRLDRVKLVILGQGFALERKGYAVIEEILFPGYRVEGPPPGRPLNPLVLDRVAVEGNRLVAHGSHFTPRTRVVVDGRSQPIDRGDWPARLPFCFDLVATAPSATLRAQLDVAGAPEESAESLGAEFVEVYLTDGLRRSPSVRCTHRPTNLRFTQRYETHQ